jgi:glycerate kinase
LLFHSKWVNNYIIAKKIVDLFVYMRIYCYLCIEIKTKSNMGIDKELKDADVVLTGEGKIDEQSARGKAPIGIAKRAKKHGCKVLAFAGCLGTNVKHCDIKEIDEIHAISNDSIPLEQRMKRENAMNNMECKVAQVFAKMHQMLENM